MKKVLLIAIGVTMLWACKTKEKQAGIVKSEPVIDCNGKNFSYKADIKPIFEKYCNRCHSDGGAGGYDFTFIEDIHKSARNGELMGTIKWKRGFPKMPKRAARLDSTTVAKIECWIVNGMKE